MHAAAGALNGEERVDDGRHQGWLQSVVHGLSAFVTVWPLSYQSARGAASAGDGERLDDLRHDDLVRHVPAFDDDVGSR